MLRSFVTLTSLLCTVLAGEILWDGRFNDLSSSADLDKWSFSSKVGPYQWYIHGDGKTSSYINLDASYKNPADSVSAKGAKFTIDSTAYWHGQNMRRTELIPQSTVGINKGHVVYHFNLKRTATNAPVAADEHQVCFFESHFTELKYGGGQGTSDGSLHWNVGGTSQWNTTWDADIWHNVAYDIDFDAKTVGFWHSTGSDPLKQAAAPKTASTSSDGADWHLGVLRLPNTSRQSVSSQGSTGSDSGPENWYFSGVYIESAPVTTAITGPAGSTMGSSGTLASGSDGSSASRGSGAAASSTGNSTSTSNGSAGGSRGSIGSSGGSAGSSDSSSGSSSGAFGSTNSTGTGSSGGLPAANSESSTTATTSTSVPSATPSSNGASSDNFGSSATGSSSGSTSSNMGSSNSSGGSSGNAGGNSVQAGGNSTGGSSTGGSSTGGSSTGGSSTGGSSTGGSSAGGSSTGSGSSSSGSSGSTSSASSVSKLTSKDQVIQAVQAVLYYVQNQGGVHARDFLQSLHAVMD